ncbi:hypothetical protein OA84_00205 [Kaistella solincola]|uniref:Glycosyltransferase family 2 protein n=1 Tax=Kaistella solincola TaxID=510955 RepID=A0ABR4ZVR8_9FLAO|nr:hypothetical protein [Kaistella solincola]KIA84929.1 hypothetical protein OA84_00205 [Kaistella solincola]
MITILIKSFNRPFYLDRCLQSIEKFVSGKYKVKILDDGTPKKYLEKIQQKFDFAEILTSAHYAEKTSAIQENFETGQEINGFKIPTDLWVETVKNSTDYVLVTEDDVWFTQPIDLSEIGKDMENHEISLLKLGWLGNFSEDNFLNVSEINANIERTIPKKLFTANEFLMDCFMYNKFKFFTILYKFGIVDNETRRKYFALHSIAMGIYRKDYWLHLWKDAQNLVNEKQQLKNAATWYHKNKHQNFVARTKNEVLKTTFQSAATNSYHKYNVDFDVNYFNHLINEAWFEGHFDSLENFPKDFSPEYFIKFIDEKMNISDFQTWTEKFKQQYRALGASVDF